MKNRFRSEIDARLSDLTFTRQDQVLERIQARRVVRPLPKRTLIVLLALMLMLCGTAVALTLRYSARFDLERHARGILSSKYGLTGEMIDLFATRVEQDGESWTVRFIPIGWEEQMGEYAVTGSAKSDTQATWSHDGEGPSESFWGPEQLQQFMALRTAQQNAMFRQGGWNGTLEELAAIDAPILALKGAAWRVHYLPGEDDIQPEEAEALARQAIMAKYGLSQEAMDGYRTSTLHFYLYTEDGTKEYRLWMDDKNRDDEFWVSLSSPSGEITACNWHISAKDFRLPEGDLSLYSEAAKEYVSGGAFEALNAEEKAKVYRRFEEAGLDDLLPPGVYVTPAATDLNEEAAIFRAKEAMMERFAFPEEAFELFGVHTAMLRAEEGRLWQVRFIGLDQYHYYWLGNNELGDYTVAVTADGQIASCEWSLEDMYEGGFTERTFGQSTVLAGELLPYVIALKSKLDQIIAPYPEFQNRDDDLSHEDLATYDALMRDAGFDPRIYCYLLPKEGEVREAEAIEIARQVLKDEYGLTDAILDNSVLETSFLMAYYIGDEPIKGWDIVYKGRDVYTVFINAADGIIEQIVHDDDTILSNG